MKSILKFILPGLCLFYFTNGFSQDPETKICSEFWAEVNFSDICSLSPSHFDFRGENDRCNADSNDAYPYDERIYIRVYNHFYEADALQEYQDEKDYAQTVDGYMLVNDLGDDAFATRKVQLGKLDSVIIEIVKDTFTIQIEVRGNYANNSNNCFSPDTVFDFARLVADGL